MLSTQPAVEIWVPVEKDEDLYPITQDWEQLWSWPVEGVGFRIDNIPFFAKNIALGDIVAATLSDEGVLCFERVIRASGNSTFRIWIEETFPTKPEDVMGELRSLGAQTEITLKRLIAVSVGQALEDQVWSYLQLGVDRGYWEMQVGCSPD